MPVKLYRVDEFTGIDESRDENSLPAGASPDACNMDTSNGALRVAKGYTRRISVPVPGTEEIRALCVFNSASGERTVVCAGNTVYAWNGTEWSAVYTYGGEGLTEHRFDFARAQIGAADNLIIGCGEAQLIKYDGATASVFGSAENVSDIHALYLALYRSRLFAAGDLEHPNRLYWSQLPGSGRTIEAWGPVSASPNVEGGHTEVGSMAGDPIVGLAALSNQLLIFKRASIYRLIGEKPGNFTVEEVDSRAGRTVHTAIARCADALYFMTAQGICCFNGVTAQPMADARKLSKTVRSADVSASVGALCADRLYFTVEEPEGQALVEYDLVRGTYMLRRGFTVKAMCAVDGTLLIADGSRYICAFNEGADYAGEAIEAHWRTPETDLHEKSAIKGMRALYMRGGEAASGANGPGVALLDVTAGGVTSTKRIMLPEDTHGVLETPLEGEGRTFSMKFSNEAGGSFHIASGVELEFDMRRRTV